MYVMKKRLCYCQYYLIVKQKHPTLETITKNKTTITIAHRLSTIVNSDQIILLSKGKIVDAGNHKELIKSSDYYKKLYHAGA